MALTYLNCEMRSHKFPSSTRVTRLSKGLLLFLVSDWYITASIDLAMDFKPIKSFFTRKPVIYQL